MHAGENHSCSGKGKAGGECCGAYCAGRKTRELAEKAMHDVQETAAHVAEDIREHPVKASAIAAGLGFLVGNLFRRC